MVLTPVFGLSLISCSRGLQGLPNLLQTFYKYYSDPEGSRSLCVESGFRALVLRLRHCLNAAGPDSKNLVVYCLKSHLPYFSWITTAPVRSSHSARIKFSNINTRRFRENEFAVQIMSKVLPVYRAEIDVYSTFKASWVFLSPKDIPANHDSPRRSKKHVFLLLWSSTLIW